MQSSWRNGGRVNSIRIRLTSGALYENEYIKENGIWKLRVLKYRPQWHSTFEKGIPNFCITNNRMGSHATVLSAMVKLKYRNFIPFVNTKYPEGTISVSFIDCRCDGP